MGDLASKYGDHIEKTVIELEGRLNKVKKENEKILKQREKAAATDVN